MNGEPSERHYVIAPMKQAEYDKKNRPDLLKEGKVVLSTHAKSA
jgi:hypothetical protein